MNKLKVDVCIKSLLIFGGIIMMQLISYMLCFCGFIFVYMKGGETYNDALKTLAGTMRTNVFLSYVSAVSALLSLIWCAVLYKKSSWRVKGINYREVFSIKNVVYISGAAIGGCIIVTFLLSAVSAAFPALFEKYMKLMANFDADGFSIVLVYVLFIGPVSEEFIFRGALFDRFHLGFGFWKANVLQAFFFGVYHMNIIQGIYAFCIGMVLGIIVYSTGSILCSVMAHILFNTTTYVLPFITNVKPLVFKSIIMLFITFMAILALIAVRYFVKISNEKVKKNENGYGHCK